MAERISEIECLINKSAISGANLTELEQFVESPEVVPVAINVFNQSIDQKTIFYLAIAIKKKLRQEWDQFEAEVIDQIFHTIMERLLNHEMPLEQKSIIPLIYCLSIISTSNLSYFELVSQFNANYLLYFYQFCCEITVDYLFFNYAEAITYLNSCVPIFVKILADADLSIEWFRFLCSVLLKTSYENLAPLLPKIALALECPELFSSIDQLLENVVLTPYSNVLPGDIPFVNAVFEIALTMIDTIFQGEIDKQQFYFVSVVYQPLFSYDPAYYVAEEHLEFSANLFSRFFVILENFTAEGIEYELISLLNSMCDMIRFTSILKINDQLFIDLTYAVLDFMVALIDNYEARYICADFSICFEKISSESYKHILKYFTEKINQGVLTAGHIYAISYLAHSPRTIYSSITAYEIIKMEDPPFTVIFFVRNCISDTPSLHFNSLMQMCYQFFESMPQEVADTICDVAHTMWSFIAADPPTYITPIMEWLDFSNADITAKLMSALFSTLSHADPENPEAIALFQQLTVVFDTAVSTILERDVRQAVVFVTTVINGTPREDIDDSYKEYFGAIFDSFFPALEGLWDDMNPTIQQPLAHMMSKAVCHHWASPEAYSEHIVAWLSLVFPDHATKNHFNVLLRTQEWIDPSEVAGVLAQFLEAEDSQALLATSFAADLAVTATNEELSAAALQYLFEMLERGPFVGSRTLQILTRMFKNESQNERVLAAVSANMEEIVRAVMKYFMQIMQPQELRDLVNTLWELQSNIDAMTLAQMVVANAGGTPEAENFAQVFVEELSSSEPTERIMIAAAEMIRAFGAL